MIPLPGEQEKEQQPQQMQVGNITVNLLFAADGQPLAELLAAHFIHQKEQ